MFRHLFGPTLSILALGMSHAPAAAGVLKGSNATAMAITGNVELSEEALAFEDGTVFNFADLEAGSIRVGGKSVPADLYRAEVASDPVFTNGNAWCGKGDVTFVAAWDGPTADEVTIAVFTTQDRPQAAEEMCASYSYVSAQAQVDAAENAMAAVWDAADLHFIEALFVTEPAMQYGAYTPRDNDVFVSGETLLIYLEPRAFGYGDKGDYWTVDVALDLFIFDAAGEVVFEQYDFGAIALESRVRNREIMFMASVDLEGLPAGTYQLDIEMRDLNKGQSDIVGLPFTMAPPS